MKKHWSHPDYGISSVNSDKGYFLVRVNSLINDQVKMINRVVTYDKYGGKEAALEVAREVRNDLLVRPEVISYLNHVYVAPKRLDIMVRRSRNTEEELTVPGLDGVHIETRIKKKGPGKHAVFYNAIAIAPKGFADGTDRFSRSMRKYGIEKALRMVTEWRADRIGAPSPSEKMIRAATDYVESTLGDKIREQERLFREDQKNESPEF